jgi:hypothetical protein
VYTGAVLNNVTAVTQRPGRASSTFTGQTDGGRPVPWAVSQTKVYETTQGTGVDRPLPGSFGCPCLGVERPTLECLERAVLVETRRV